MHRLSPKNRFRNTNMLSFEERKALLIKAVNSVSPEELCSQICSVEAVGPTVSEFFGLESSKNVTTYTYTLSAVSCFEASKDLERSYPKVKTAQIKMGSTFKVRETKRAMFNYNNDISLAA